MNRNILRLSVLLSFLLTSGIVRSQGFAGGDKSAFFDPNVGKAVVTLGSSDYASDVYYRWDYVSEVSNGGAFDINDQFASRPELTFHNPGEYVFRCTQISKYGHKSEYVVVTVQSKIDLVSVRLKENHNCFLNGYVLSTNDFEIETFPEDGKDYIEVAAPDVINVATHGAWPFQIHEVGFTSIDENGDRYDCDLKCKIPVIDDNRYVSYDKMKKNLKTISSDMEENVDLLEESFGSLTRLNCFSNPAYILPPALYSLVNPQGAGGMLSAGIKGMNFLKAFIDALEVLTVSPTLTYDCEFKELGIKLACDGGDIYPIVYLDGKFATSISISVDQPLATLYGLNLYASGGIGASLTMDCSNKVLNPKMGNLRIPLTITPNISVGLTVAVLNPSILSATAGFQFDFNVECYMDYNSVLKADDKACPECWEISDNGFEYDNFHVTMWLKSSATAVGFQMIENTYQVFDIHSINQLSF